MYNRNIDLLKSDVFLHNLTLTYLIVGKVAVLESQYFSSVVVRRRLEAKFARRAGSDFFNCSSPQLDMEPRRWRHAHNVVHYVCGAHSDCQLADADGPRVRRVHWHHDIVQLLDGHHFLPRNCWCVRVCVSLVAYSSS